MRRKQEATRTGLPASRETQHDLSTSSIRSRRFLPAYDASPRPLKDDFSNWLPNAIFRRIKPVQSRYGDDGHAVNWLICIKCRRGERRHANIACLAANTAIQSTLGTIMDGLRWTAIIVVAMLGGGLAVCALIALVVLFIGHVAARLFNNDEHD